MTDGLGGEGRRAIRLLLWLALLLAVATSAGAVTWARQRRTRGIPHGFQAPVAEADVPTLGINVALEQYDDQRLASMLTRVVEGGFVWVRQAFYWSHIEPVPGEPDWTVPDRIVAAVDRHPQLRLVAVLEDDPPAPPEDPDEFADFAAAYAERYGRQVDYYQVWDEPNLADHWGDGPVSPAAYADLLMRTASAIRTVDPDARILLAGLAPTTEISSQNLSDVRYLERLYQAGAEPAFDIVAAKPYGFATGPYDRRADEAVLDFSRPVLLREVIVANDDADTAIWASHWGWNALPRGWEGAPSIWGQTDEETQAARTVAALGRVRDEWPWTGAMILENLQPADRASTRLWTAAEDPRWGFSLLGPNGSPRPVYNAVAEWARSLPDAAPVGGYPAQSRWATYEGSWRVGPLGADVGVGGGRARFRFNGTRVAVTARRGPYRAFLYVTVDGEPANALPRDEEGRSYVVLYDKVPRAATVPLATGLDPGVHTVEVVPSGAQGQWPVVDWRVGAAPVRTAYVWKLAGLTAAALVLGTFAVREVRRLDWSSLGRMFLRWPEWAQTAVTVGLTGLFWAAAALGWGRLSSYSLVPVLGLILSLLVLLPLTFAFVLRLDLGLTLTACSAPFYLVPRAMFYRALALPEVLLVVCLAAWCVSRTVCRGVLGQRRSVNLTLRKPAGADCAVALLLAAALVSSAAAEDRVAGLFELRTIFFLPALGYALVRLARLDDEAKRRIVDGFVVGGMGVALVGLAQAALGRNLVVAEGGLRRLQSVYGSPNNVGLYLGRVWPLLAASAMWGTSRRQRLYALAVLPTTLALLLSFSRGALLLALPAAIVTMGWLARGRFRWLALALVLGIALAFIPLLRLPRFASLLHPGQGTTFFRLKLWRSSLQIVADHPLLGVGPGNFPSAYRTRYVLPAAWQEFNLEHPHNILLDHWTRLGLLGLLAGAAVQVAFWRTICRATKRDPLWLGLAGGMAAVLAHGLVDNSVFFPDLALVSALALAIVADQDLGDGRPRQ